MQRHLFQLNYDRVKRIIVAFAQVLERTLNIGSQFSVPIKDQFGAFKKNKCPHKNSILSSYNNNTNILIY